MSFFTKKIPLLLLALVFSSSIGWGQCVLNANAVPGLTLTHVSTNVFNNSGVAYNPIQNLYYGVRAGNTSFPLETWSSVGTPLSLTTAGFDWRGMWWNPATNQLEGNGYATSGMWRANLDPSGYALSTGANLFAGQNQPDPQSCGDLDYHANEVVYYFNGRIYRYSRATNAALGNYALTGIPTALGNINWTTVVYTGCATMEIGILDWSAKRIYLFNKANGAYTATSQLPGSAITTNGFRFSYANGLAWLFDVTTRTWYSYQIFATVLPAEGLSFEAGWESETTVGVDWSVTEQEEVASYVVERATDGVSFQPLKSFSAQGADLQFHYVDAQLPKENTFYYRLRIRDLNGNETLTSIKTLTRTDQNFPELLAGPVPASNQVSVWFQISGAESAVLQVHDIQGKSVMDIPVGSSQLHEAKMDLDVSGWADGLYLLTLRGNNGAQLSGKLFVQH